MLPRREIKRSGADLFTPLVHFLCEFGFGFRHEIALLLTVKAAFTTAGQWNVHEAPCALLCILTRSEDVTLEDLDFVGLRKSYVSHFL